MKLQNYSIQLLFLAAVKAEKEAVEVYSDLKNNFQDVYLQDRLDFLITEEKHHKRMLEGMFKELFPDEVIVLPKRSPVPIPEINENAEDEKELLKEAMDAEIWAAKYYKSFSNRFDEDSKMNKTLKYLAKMERGHYLMFETELEKIKGESKDG
ncbi:MAG: ferritin family protein [Candidatus Saliniplasma sp.]